jgi:hypothetical protein
MRALAIVCAALCLLVAVPLVSAQPIDTPPACLDSVSVCAWAGTCIMTPDGSGSILAPIKPQLVGGQRGVDVMIPTDLSVGDYYFSGICATLTLPIDPAH